MLNFHCWYMLKWLLWEFDLKWWKWCCFCCLLVMNPWLCTMNVVGYMLVVMIYELGDDKCVVVVKLLCFCENGLKVEKFEFDEFEWINEVIMMNWIEENCFQLMCFGEKSFGGKSGFCVKSRFKHFCEISHFGWFELSYFGLENNVLK